MQRFKRQTASTLCNKFLKFLASLKLAVFVIISVGFLTAIGTVVETKYGAEVAQTLVYHSFWMYSVMGLLCINLTQVMIDRWPWKRHHSGFIFAHIGIIILLFGSVVTRYFGVDGSLSIDIGEKGRYVSVTEKELAIYSSFGGRFKRLYLQPINFLQNRPTKENPYVVPLGSKDLKVIEYHHFANRQVKVIETQSEFDPPAIRFQLQNANVNMTQWFVKDRKKTIDFMDLGPARVVLAPESFTPTDIRNEILLSPVAGQSKLKYRIFTKSKGGQNKEGFIAAGDTIETGWMGLKLRMLNYFPHATEKAEYSPSVMRGELDQPAIKIIYDNKEYWVGLNSALRLYTDVNMYVVSFANRRIDLGFDLELKKFEVGRYQGSSQAKTYASDVYVKEIGEHKISMNEPLKYKGFTFYQASFSQDESGNPIASVLSVNKDPGRPIKYFGSFLIVLGSLILFYFKRMKWRKKS